MLSELRTISLGHTSEPDQELILILSLTRQTGEGYPCCFGCCAGLRAVRKQLRFPQGLELQAPTPRRLNTYSYHLHMFLKAGCLKPFLWELALNSASLPHRFALTSGGDGALPLASGHSSLSRVWFIVSFCTREFSLTALFTTNKRGCVLLILQMRKPWGLLLIPSHTCGTRVQFSSGWFLTPDSTKPADLNSHRGYICAQPGISIICRQVSKYTRYCMYMEKWLWLAYTQNVSYSALMLL